MTFLVEIRCDNRDQKNSNCWSHENSDCFGTSKHNVNGAKEVALKAINAHVNAGWLIKNELAYCPSCIEFLKLK